MAKVTRTHYFVVHKSKNRTMQKLFIFLCLSFYSLVLCGQQEVAGLSPLVQIETHAGDKINGLLLRQDDTHIVLQTSMGEMKIGKINIAKLDYIRDNIELSGEYSGSHYLLSQSAFGLRKGQSYYENVALFFNSYTYGVSDNFSITGGVELVPLLFFGQLPGLFVTPKVHFPFEKGAGSLSTSILSYTIDGDSFTAGVLQGALTFGSHEKNVTIGAGFGYDFQSGFETSIVPITISGMARISDRLSFISENVIVATGDDSVAILSAGLRIFSRSKNNFLTVALFRPTVDTGPLLVLPLFSGTVAIK